LPILDYRPNFSCKKIIFRKLWCVHSDKNEEFKVVRSDKNEEFKAKKVFGADPSRRFREKNAKKRTLVPKNDVTEPKVKLF